MPVICGDCNAANPPESRFCHRCGVALSLADATLHPSPPRGREPGIRDIGADLKTLSVDVSAYSAPRIRQGAIFVGRNTRSFVAYTAPRVKRGSITVARNAKGAAPRIKSLFQRSRPDGPEAAPPPFPTRNVSINAETLTVPSSSAAAITCPRCRSVSEPGSLFCFTCGLPLDDVEPAAQDASAYLGQRAGFWVRFGAWLIDAVILAAVQIGLIAIWPGFSEYFDENSGPHWVDLLPFVLGVLYYTVGVGVWATTVGKRLMGLYVSRPEGVKVGLGRALARYFAGVLSGLIFGIGYLMIGLRSDKRGLHDLICDTQIVRK